MQQAPSSAPDEPASDAAVTDSGSYELLKQRLAKQGQDLLQKAQGLNEARLAAFGRMDQSLQLRTRARTENNCNARDIVRIGPLLLFGYNVFIGLRKEIAAKDVFALYRLGAPADGDAGAHELQAVPLAGTFLEEPRFAADFRELYTYYKNATLLQLRVTQDKLLAAFQIGQQLHDLRVFRWQIERDGSVHYIDNRGERDMLLPPSHDFEWTLTTREDHVGGRHPHVNVLDEVFVETLGGDLTVKIENNTETGLGIYSEPVEDKSQALVDAEVAYAQIGLLILLRVRPYRELTTRYLVFNGRTQSVERIDAIGASCVRLPEDQGIVFPGGYYLQSGEYKKFDLPAEVAGSLRFKRMVRSPNGEDVLYVFYQPGDGRYALFTYNLINKTMAAPIVSNGYARFDDGRILVFQAESAEPSRVHPMQVWQTPFVSEEHANAQPVAQGFFGRVGNAELVRGVSELMGIARAVREQAPTRVAYDDLIRQCSRVSDGYFWLDAPEAGDAAAVLADISAGARATLAEFEKVDGIRKDTARALAQAEAEQRALATDIASTLWRAPQDFIAALARLRQRRGALQALKELRYADLPRIQAMDDEIQAEQQRVGERALKFLAEPSAFDAHHAELHKVAADIQAAVTTTALVQALATLDERANGLDLLTEQLGTLPGGDAVVRTAILDRVSAVYAGINRLRAEARNKRKSMGAAEAAAEFGAQFKLFGQAVENAVEFADTPERCDDALTRLLAQLEELEGRFAEQEQFLSDIAAKREAVYEAMGARRQSLTEARQRRALALGDAAQRILDGVPRRVSQLSDAPAVLSYFAADALVAKLRGLIGDLRALGAAVQADDIDTRLKTARDQALRAVRDKQDLFADGGNTLRLGRHAFTISRQAPDLALVPTEGGMAMQITGTDYLSPVHDEVLDSLRPFWTQTLVSETPALARCEYLAGLVLEEAIHSADGQAWAALHDAAADAEAQHTRLLQLVRTFAAPRYREGYQKGVHDEDAARLLAPLVAMQQAAGLFVFSPTDRALAALYWMHGLAAEARDSLRRRARAALQMQRLFAARDALHRMHDELAQALAVFAPGFGMQDASSPEAARYLLRQIAEGDAQAAWIMSSAGADLAEALSRELGHATAAGNATPWQQDLAAAEPAERWHLALEWVRAYAQAHASTASAWVCDAAAMLALELPRTRVSANLDGRVEGLLSEHERIAQGRLAVNLNDFWQRFHRHQRQIVPSFEALQQRRHVLIEQEKKRLRLSQLQAKPLSTFVRNRLIDEVYLPLVGDNLAKQIGAAGEGNRSDRMGLLLLISPPGYGKTTLMEYVADRLGLIFVRINCPALGHDITAIDPASAAHSAARQELEKLNLGLAMGSNVMLYLDDIQHTAPEFLQKFIALADGTRRIEGVFNGEPRTYDLRGKRFAIVMAGNPYTESGDVFKIPDMLANRADIYNLGDVLSGREALFGLSYIENCLTSNPVLMPLASRDPKDVQLLAQMAQGQEVASSAFSHTYSAAELDELQALLRRLFRVRDALLKVNLAYIDSAAQQEAYRDEPAFKLQGSYRNMTKLAGKVTALMRDDEIDALLRDHYRGEAQTLTTGAEENLLRLAQLLGTPSAEESARWQQMCAEFVRLRKLGGSDVDGSQRIASGLLDVARAVDELKPLKPSEPPEPLKAAQASAPEPSDGLRMAEALLEVAITYRKIIMPLIAATERRLDMDQSVRDEMERVGREMDRLVKPAGKPTTPKKGSGA